MHCAILELSQTYKTVNHVCDEIKILVGNYMHQNPIQWMLAPSGRSGPVTKPEGVTKDLLPNFATPPGIIIYT